MGTAVRETAAVSHDRRLLRRVAGMLRCSLALEREPALGSGDRLSGNPTSEFLMEIEQTIDKIREICLGFPEAEERETWEQPTFRVRDKIFAMIHQHQGALTVWCKAPKGVQGALLD